MGIPTQVLALAAYCSRKQLSLSLRTILISSDFMAESLRRRLEDAFRCRVFNHYGSTEMGFGGALEDSGGTGLVLRDQDLYFEIIDPATGRPVPTGTEGELVFTTLTRTAMPLIRYRTGDVTRFLPHIAGKISTPYRHTGCQAAIGNQRLLLKSLDELIFADAFASDFSAEVVVGPPAVLRLRIWGGLADRDALTKRHRDVLLQKEDDLIFKSDRPFLIES